MDVQMPVMDGLEATRLIQADCRTKHGEVTTPILAMSANVFADDRTSTNLSMFLPGKICTFCQLSKPPH